MSRFTSVDFSRAGGADQRDRLARTRVQGDVLQHVGAPRVGKAHVLEFKVTPDWLLTFDVRLSTFDQPRLHRLVEDLEHALRRRATGLEHLVEGVQFPDRIVEKLHQGEKRDEFANLHLSRQHRAAAEKTTSTRPQFVKKFIDGL